MTFLAACWPPPCVHPAEKHRVRTRPSCGKSPRQRPFDGVFAARVARHERCYRRRGGWRPCCAAPCSRSARVTQRCNFRRPQRWPVGWTAGAADADASEMMPWDSLHAALWAVPNSCAGRAQVRIRDMQKRRGGLRSIHWRAGAGATHDEHECAHVCRPSEYASVVSVISMYQMYGLHTLRVAAIDLPLPVLTSCFRTGFDTWCLLAGL